VDLSQCETKARLTEAHEIAHQIIPWHQAAFQLDDEERLLGKTRDELERQAYLAGGHLIFQGEHFWRRALDYQVSIGTPIALAPEYGASLHAAIRYYVLHHPDRVSVLVAGRYQNRAGRVPVWESVDSPSFLAKFGMLADRMAGQLMIGGDGQPLGDIAMKAMSGAGVAVKDVIIPDISGERCPFIAEAFYNRFNLFVMVTEKKAAARFARHVRVAAS
jgi:hypothetical protein